MIAKSNICIRWYNVPVCPTTDAQIVKRFARITQDSDVDDGTRTVTGHLDSKRSPSIAGQRPPPGAKGLRAGLDYGTFLESLNRPFRTTP